MCWLLVFAFDCRVMAIVLFVCGFVVVSALSVVVPPIFASVVAVACVYVCICVYIYMCVCVCSSVMSYVLV